MAVNKKETSEKEEMTRKMFLLHKWSILRVKVGTCDMVLNLNRDKSFLRKIYLCKKIKREEGSGS